MIFKRQEKFNETTETLFLSGQRYITMNQIKFIIFEGFFSVDLKDLLTNLRVILLFNILIYWIILFIV